MQGHSDERRHRELAARYPDLLEQLLPGELLCSVSVIQTCVVSRASSALRSLLTLGRVSRIQDLGEVGPVMASMTFDETDQAPELRLFEALFGRDALQVSEFLGAVYPKLRLATVLALAELQGREFNVAREEEPGRIPHEVRQPDDPIALRITEASGWAWPYYGAVDVTPKWIRAVAQCASKDLEVLRIDVQGSDGRKRTLCECLRAATDWLVNRLSESPYGLLESRPAFPGAIENQVWKDSWDAFFHADGTLPRMGTVASVETQASAYDALLDAIELQQIVRRTWGQSPLENLASDHLRTLARNLRSVILNKFWIDEASGPGGGFLALGADRDEANNLRPLAVRTSNMGQVLCSRLLDGRQGELDQKRTAIVRSLFAPDLLCPGGIRTLSTREAKFRPGAYHNGSSWPWDTYMIARGLHRNGYHGLAWELCQRVLHLCNLHNKFPEFVRGEANLEPSLNTRVVEVIDRSGRRNRIEQLPQEIQAWTVAAIVAIKMRCARLRLRLGDALPQAAIKEPWASLERHLLDNLGSEL